MITRTPDPAVPYFDVADPAFCVTSAEVRRAREAGWYARTSYGLAVLRYDQVSRLIRHPALRQGSRLWPAHHGITSGPFADWWASWVLNLEGEAHQRMRRLLSPAFSRRIVEALRPRFGALAGELTDSFAGAGRCEFMADFAEPYAARVIAIMLGIAEEEWPTIAAESATVGLAMGVRIREHLPRIEAALAALYDYADAVIAARQREPRDDLVTSLVKSQAGEGGVAGDGLTGAELRDALVLLIFGGFDTTRNQLGLAIQVFLEHTAQWRLLGEHPELGAAAVEEVMRVRPTTTWVTREALADFTFQVFLEHTAQWRLLGEHPELGAAAVEEVMRVRPTTTWVTREALADFTFDGLGPPRPGSPGKPWPTSPSTVSTSRPGPRSTCSANRREPTPHRQAAGNSTSRRPVGRPTSGPAAEFTTASGITWRGPTWPPP